MTYPTRAGTPVLLLASSVARMLPTVGHHGRACALTGEPHRRIAGSEGRHQFSSLDCLCIIDNPIYFVAAAVQLLCAWSEVLRAWVVEPACVCCVSCLSVLRVLPKRACACVLPKLSFFSFIINESAADFRGNSVRC
jgi:hypothetical protein